MTGSVVFEHHDRVVVARVSGEIDISTVEGIETAILGEARTAPDGGLVVDLSDVGFLDSAGIRLLFTLHRVLTERGRPMAIVVPEGARIASVLSIVEIASVVWVSPTLDGAIGKLFRPDDGGAGQPS